jgi:hypothetical protein
VAFAGSNKDVYPFIQRAAVDIGSSALFLSPNGQRVYLNEARDNFPGPIPAAWPKLSDPNARACVSIRPALYELVTGRSDTALRAFLTTAPGGATSLLGLWHEASTDGPGGIYKPYFNSLNRDFPKMGGAKGLLTRAQAYVQRKALLWKANVKVGAIEVVENTDPRKLGSALDPWMAKNLDFYACDVYDFKDGNANPADLLQSFRTVCDNLMSSGPATIGITETNSRFPGRRPYWFLAAWSWLKSHGFTSNATCFLTYWNKTGIESGAWISDDWATIDALYAIFSESSP